MCRLLFILPWLAGCNFPPLIPTLTPLAENSAETDDRTVLEGNTGTRIPPSATGIHGYVDGFRDVTTYLRFQIPSADLAEFMKSTACTTPLSTEDTGQQLQGYPDLPWWAPEKAEEFGSCTGVTDILTQLVFVDMTDPLNYVVYVIASTR
jgi:hypothetical protein